MASPLSLHALTAAALILPGLIQHTVHAAEDDEVDFQYSHYQEGKRDIYAGDTFLDPVTGANGVNGVSPPAKRTNPNPIEVDSLHGSGLFSMTDRVKFAFNYIQDTWPGATPLGTAPAVIDGNKLNDGVTGASPYASPGYSSIFMDSKGNIFSAVTNLFIDQPPVPWTKQLNQLTHVLSYASPETRKQGDFSLSYDRDETAVNVAIIKKRNL